MAGCSPRPGEDQTVKVWDSMTGELLHDLSGHERRVVTVAFSPDGQRLASGGFDTTVRVWDARTDREELTFGKHKRIVFSVASAPTAGALPQGVRNSRQPIRVT